MTSATFDAAMRELASPPEHKVDLSRPFADLFRVDGATVSTLGSFLGTATVSATSPLAARIDELQFDLGEGPCWDAMAASAPVIEPDVAKHVDRWPAFIEAIRSHGVTSIFAFPLRLGPIRIGAIDLYSLTRTDLDPFATNQASLLAHQVSRRVMKQALTSVREGADRQTSAFSRRVVHQATGMVVSQLDITTEDAELVIQGHAYAEGLTMMDVAQRLVDRQLRFSQAGEAAGSSS